MPNENAEDKPAYISAKEMQDWLQQEIKDAAKALELRVREAAEFVTAYSLGELTPAQAHERHWRYDHRWGEPLPGTHAFTASSDEEILAAIDGTRGACSTPDAIKETYARLLRGKPPAHSP